MVNSVAHQQATQQAFAEAAALFWQRYLVSLLQEVLAVLTDTMHKSGFKAQAAVLRALIQRVELGLVELPLGADDANQPQQAGESNGQYLRRYVANMLARYVVECVVAQ